MTNHAVNLSNAEQALIVSVAIGPMPRPMPMGMFDQKPTVTVVYDNGMREQLFSFYPDEISFSEQDFLGLTRGAAMELRHVKDVAYLQDRS